MTSAANSMLVALGPGLVMQLYRCTACGQIVCLNVLPNFCPLCGAGPTQPKLEVIPGVGVRFPQPDTEVRP